MEGPDWAVVAPLTPGLSPEDHEWLLSEEVDVLPFLLLPLAGPEELPEEETEREWVPGWVVGVRGIPRAPP